MALNDAFFKDVEWIAGIKPVSIPIKQSYRERAYRKHHLWAYLRVLLCAALEY